MAGEEGGTKRDSNKGKEIHVIKMYMQPLHWPLLSGWT